MPSANFPTDRKTVPIRPVCGCCRQPPQTPSPPTVCVLAYEKNEPAGVQAHPRAHRVDKRPISGQYEVPAGLASPLQLVWRPRPEPTQSQPTNHPLPTTHNHQPNRPDPTEDPTETRLTYPTRKIHHLPHANKSTYPRAIAHYTPTNPAPSFHRPPPTTH